MTATSRSRGWPIEWVGKSWIYSDTRQLDDGQRAGFALPCALTAWPCGLSESDAPCVPCGAMRHRDARPLLVG